MLRNFFAREDRSVEGQTMVEYALILFLISVVAIVILGTLGQSVNTVFTTINNAFSGAGAGS